MKWLLPVSVFLLAVPLLFSQDIGVLDQNHVAVQATQIHRDGAVVELRGGAVLRTTEVSIRADEIDYNVETGSIEPRGHVQIQLVKDGKPHAAAAVDAKRAATGDGALIEQGQKNLKEYYDAHH